MNRSRVLLIVLAWLVTIVLVSSTLGREIYAGRSPGLGSFALVNFAGYLFFLVMPIEALVPIYEAEGHAAGTLILLAVITGLAGQMIDYLIGRALSDRVLGYIGEKRFERFNTKIEKWGGWAILLFNFLPLSSPNMLLVAGMTRYNMLRAFAFSSLGLTGKYVMIIYIFDLTAWWTSRTP